MVVFGGICGVFFHQFWHFSNLTMYIYGIYGGIWWYFWRYFPLFWHLAPPNLFGLIFN